LYCGLRWLDYYKSIFLELFAYLFNFELNRFLIALSVRPVKNLAISHHLLPICPCISRIILSSSWVHFSFLMFGSKWLCHLSRHYLPILPGRAWATALQFLGPLSTTMLRRISSSSFDQDPLEANEADELGSSDALSSNQRLKH
jgi:hypothetical protein